MLPAGAANDCVQAPRWSADSAYGPVTSTRRRIPERQRAVVLQQHRRSGGGGAHRAVGRPRSARCARRPRATYGSSKSPSDSFSASTRATASSTARGRAGRGEVRGSQVGRRAAHLDVEARGVGHPHGVREVAGDAVGDEVPHAVGVAHDDPVEAPLRLQHVGQQPPVRVHRPAAHRVEGRHDGCRALLHGRAERLEVHVPQAVLRGIHRVVVAAALGLPVRDEVLGGGRDRIGCRERRRPGSRAPSRAPSRR